MGQTRYTTEQVNQRLAPRGIKLVGEWQGMKYQNSFSCLQGHTWQSLGLTTVRLDHGCPNCASTTRRLTTEQVNQRLATRKLKLVGEWKGVGKLNRFQCSLGHTWKATGSTKLLQHGGCPKCTFKAKELTTEEVNKRLAPRGLKLKGKWLGAKKTNRFVCSSGHTWAVKGSAPVHAKSGCPHCKALANMLTTEEISGRLKPKGVYLIGNWKGIRVQNTFGCLSCGHTWKVRGRGPVTDGFGCPACNPFPDKMTTEQVNARLAERNLSLVGEWKGTKKSNRYKCSLGHEWETMGHAQLDGSRSCPECARLRHKNRRASNVNPASLF